MIDAQEALILVGRKVGASVRLLSELTEISTSAVSRRHDAARKKLRDDQKISELTEKIECDHWQWVTENRKSQA